jgi:predicted nucleotidyltransferase
MNLAAHMQRAIADYFSGKPVVRAYLFGSYARGDADSNSDVDVLVEWDYDQEPRIWKTYVLMMAELEATLGRKVDLITSDGISEYIAPQIHRDKRLIYER